MSARRSTPASPSLGEGNREEFPWVSSRTLRFTTKSEYQLGFPPECPVQLNFVHLDGNYQLVPNYHDFFELILVCAGSGDYMLEGRRYPVAVGDLVLVGSHELHTVKVKQGQAVKCAALHFRSELVHVLGSSALDFEYLKPFYYRSPNFSPRIDRASLPEGLALDRIQRMHREIQMGGAGYPLAVKTYLTDILLETSRHYRDVGGEWIPRDRRIRDFERLRVVLSFIGDHFHESISLEQVAQMAHFSPNYFCRFFKSLTGYTLTEYVLLMRVDLATELLLSSKKSITTIAYETGFSSHSHLDRVFKRLKGITPLECRRQSVVANETHDS